MKHKLITRILAKIQFARDTLLYRGKDLTELEREKLKCRIDTLQEVLQTIESVSRSVK